MNTNELNDSSSNNASLDLINIGMGLGGVTSGGDLSSSSSSSSTGVAVNASTTMSSQFSIGHLMKSHTPPPAMPNSGSLMPSNQMLNTPNNLQQQFKSQAAAMSSSASSTSKSASKKRKIDDIGIENISDSENSSSGSNSSSKLFI